MNENLTSTNITLLIIILILCIAGVYLVLAHASIRAALNKSIDRDQSLNDVAVQENPTLGLALLDRWNSAAFEANEQHNVAKAYAHRYHMALAAMMVACGGVRFVDSEKNFFALVRNKVGQQAWPYAPSYESYFKHLSLITYEEAHLGRMLDERTRDMEISAAIVGFVRDRDHFDHTT